MFQRYFCSRREIPVAYVFQSYSMLVAAVVRGTVAGTAVRKHLFDTDYAVIRIWALADGNVGPVTFLCYDRRRFRLYRAEQKPDFVATQALGTLSNLYTLSF